MKYIRVKRDLRVYTRTNGCFYFIKNELITFKRFKNICNAYNLNRCKLLQNNKTFEFFETKQQNTYWFFFGCRFVIDSCEKDYRF